MMSSDPLLEQGRVSSLCLLAQAFFVREPALQVLVLGLELLIFISLELGGEGVE